MLKRIKNLCDHVRTLLSKKGPSIVPQSTFAPLTVDTVLLVHGYSVQLLNNYALLPQLFADNGLSTKNILLSAFVSLDDEVSCDDLAYGLENRILALEAAGKINLRKTAIIAHSTGAMVVRRWILNRVEKSTQKDLPLQFISCAGANHGSTLAQLGRSAFAKIFREIEQHTSVGARVLEDLDYGSSFLRRLNGAWLKEWNDPTSRLKDVFCFSLGGADHSFWKNQLAWQAHETGSDGTVRISSANLNYRWIKVDVQPDGSITAVPEPMTRLAAHLVIDDDNNRYSHTSQSEQDTTGLVLSAAAGIIESFTDQRNLKEPVTDSVRGILDGILAFSDQPFGALMEAMAVGSQPAYDRVAHSWQQQTQSWYMRKGSDGLNHQANSTIVVSLSDDEGTPIHDSLIMIKDDAGNVKTVSKSLEPHQPIFNRSLPATMSFYVNADQWLAIHPHRVSVEITSGTPYAKYAAIVDAPISNDTFHAVAPNEFTYIDFRVRRDTSEAYSLYRLDDPAIARYGSTPYPPLPESELFLKP